MSKMKLFLMTALASLSLAVTAQDVDEDSTPVEWYLDEVVRGTFVQEYGFDYYYTPSGSDMKQQRANGEVTYFLNTPTGLNSKKTCALIDRIMANCEGTLKMNDWQTTATTCWKEFSMERNKIRVSVKTKALDDGTYYVSVTETANAYKVKPAAKQEKKQDQDKVSSTKRGARSDRKPVVLPDEPNADLEADTETATLTDEDEDEDDGEETDDISEVQQSTKREREAAKRLEQEKQREQARAQREAEKLRKAEEKKAKQEQEALKKEQEKLKKEQEKQLREEEKQRQAAERQQQALARQEQKKERERQAAYSASKYHYTDVALWLSDKYDFTQTAAGANSLTMYSTAIKDVEMTKLAIKNALKGSNARMAIPWRVNGDNQAVETGFTVDNHVLVIAINTDNEERVSITITEVSNDQFEQFKQGLQP